MTDEIYKKVIQERHMAWVTIEKNGVTLEHVPMKAFATKQEAEAYIAGGCGLDDTFKIIKTGTYKQ